MRKVSRKFIKNYRVYGDPHDYNLDEIVKEMVFFRGLSFYTLQMCGTAVPPNPDCTKKNFTIFGDLVRSTCKEMMKECKWNNEKFDCCEYFVPLDSELGTCFAINSKQSRYDIFQIKYAINIEIETWKN